MGPRLHLVNPTHLYATGGVYTVTLTAQDGAGWLCVRDDVVITIQPVNNAFSKTASYVASGSCPPVFVQFTNTSRELSFLLPGTLAMGRRSRMFRTPAMSIKTRVRISSR